MTLRHPTRRMILTTGLAELAARALRVGRTYGRLGGPAFGTGWHVTLPANAASSLRATLENRLSRIDRLMSPWRPDSAIYRFNAAGTGWQRADTELLAVTRAAFAVGGMESGGAFDSSGGPLVGRWGFGPIRREAAEGPAFDLSDDAIRKRTPGLTLDLCGIAKGHALDRLAALLLDMGQADFVIDLDGEMAAHGRHPDGRRRQLAVEDPRPGHAGAAEIVVLEGHAIAPSGDKANGFTLGTRRYSHIIDPATEEPVQGAAASVSVIASDAMRMPGRPR